MGSPPRAHLTFCVAQVSQPAVSPISNRLTAKNYNRAENVSSSAGWSSAIQQVGGFKACITHNVPLLNLVLFFWLAANPVGMTCL
jgi:hypothetical protein